MKRPLRLFIALVAGLLSTGPAFADNDSTLINSLLESKTRTPQENLKPFEPLRPDDPGIPTTPTKPITPEKPTTPTHSDPVGARTVGSPKGEFSVSSTGAAVYNISIAAPDGGDLSPQVGISYNSQSGQGLVGYGFNITGIFSITRGGKNMFYDKTVSGVNYGIGDVFYLNGQRLILSSGSYGYDKSTYSPEGNPYTKVTLHGNASSSSCWFEVLSSDGKTYQYGNTSESRLTFTDKKNVSHVVSWYDMVLLKYVDMHLNREVLKLQ